MQACNPQANPSAALLELYRTAFDSYLQWWTALLPGTGCAPGPCAIPETQCPPRCDCTLDWETCEDKAVAGTIDVHNTGRTTVKFSLRGSVFRADCSATDVAPLLEPANFDLAPGAHQAVKVSVTPDKSFEAGRVYGSAVTIAGRYEECVQLRVRVHPSREPCCPVEHGEIPRHIRAHQWFDHFQCEELCFEPVSATRQPAPAPSPKHR